MQAFFMAIPNHIEQKLTDREADNSLRSLTVFTNGVDFYSNDYLGFSQSKGLYQSAVETVEGLAFKNGSSGSRLLSGNNTFTQEVETYLAKFYKAESALLMNSGFNANVGFLATVPAAGEVVLYDELSHASIREGLQLSRAKSYKFKHNSINDLERLLKKQKTTCYVVVESVYSMDGDEAPIKELLKLCEKHKAYLIVDEAHGVGVVGENFKGATYKLKSDYLLARIVTFGKAFGVHGAVVLTHKKVKEYMVNFCKHFIYSTADSPHNIATIKAAHQKLENSTRTQKLTDNIQFFNKLLKEHNIKSHFVKSQTAIQCAVIGDNKKTKQISKELVKQNFIIKPILSPTVAKGTERVRICLHSFNKKKEMNDLVCLLAKLLTKK